MIAIRRFALLWLIGAILLCGMFRTDIAQMRFADPDDLLRLQEVRDWIGGQSWFDVTQYRLNPPNGGGMHWSRLLDVPLAAVILLSSPLLGTPGAERAAAVVVPLLTYGTVLAALVPLTRALGGRIAAVAAGLMLAIDPGVLSAIRPMRIDHHGWQVACGMAMAALLITRCGPRSAGLAGLAAALWANISLEALPFTAAAAALLGWRWAWAPAEEGSRLAWFLAALAGGSLLLGLSIHGGALFARSWCDAVSPIQLALFAGAAIGTAGLTAWPPASAGMRLGGLALIGAMLALAYRLGAPQCAAGPFASLDPLIYRLWYLNVLEGRPLWEQPPAIAVFAVGFPIVGLAAAAWMWRGTTGQARRRWADLALLLAAATLAATMVARAGCFANVLAVPSVATVLVRLLAAIGGWRSPIARVSASAGAILLLAPPLPALAAAAIDPAPALSDAGRCAAPASLAPLDRLAPATILSPLDIAASAVVGTHHRLVASSHHRNAAGIHDVIAFFTGTPAEAEAIARRRGVRYLLLCPGSGELAVYRRAAPEGFLAELERGHTPPWLMPMRLPDLRQARLWRIVG